VAFDKNVCRSKTFDDGYEKKLLRRSVMTKRNFSVCENILLFYCSKMTFKVFLSVFFHSFKKVNSACVDLFFLKIVNRSKGVRIC
jgi:hypothetical protein